MNKELYIWHHLGLGDHITCNAIVRNYAKQYNKIYLFVKHRYLDNIEYLYRDLNNIEFISGKGEQDEFVHFYLMTHPGINLLKVWASNEYIKSSRLEFDELFYKIANIPFSKKYEDCYILRDKDTENELYKQINPNDEPFIFIHEDVNRGFLIDKTHINKKIKFIEPDPNFLIFHHLKLIEKAREIHVMESSFSCMIDHFLQNHNNANLHKYVRNISSVRQPYWNIIK